MINFEWDNEKKDLNLKKHGIDFVGAVKIFDDPARIECSSFRKDEERLQTIGMVHGVVISLIYTIRVIKRESYLLDELAKMREDTMKKMPKDKTNWSKVKSLTEKQIIAAAKSDPDNKPLTKAQLKKFKRVNPPNEIDVKAIRKKLQVSQKEFASYFGVSIRTIQEWEQHRRKPTTIARNFLKVIEKAPKAVLKALAA